MRDIFVSLLLPLLAAAAPADELEQLRLIAASGWEVRALEPHEYTDAVEQQVRTWLDPPGDCQPRPVKLARGYALGEGFVVEEQSSGQWLLAQAVPGKPGHLVCAGRYVSFDALVASNGFAPPPRVPPGWKLREVVRMPDKPTRMTSDRAGKFLYVLTMHGDVYRLDPDAG